MCISYLTYLKGGDNTVRLQVLSWNVKGSSLTGWTEARKEIVKHNISKDYDLIFLQEVQWAEKGIRKWLIPSEDEFKVATTLSEDKQTNNCILYRSEKLQLLADDPQVKEVAECLQQIPDWKPEYSKRVCIGVFTVTEKGDTSKFVAISLHAHHGDKGKDNNEKFCKGAKAFAEKVVDDLGLPVLIGGDFNADIRGRAWKEAGFVGLDYKSAYAGTRKDFLTMKCLDQTHLTMEGVHEMTDQEIEIPRSAQVMKVKLKSKDTKTVKDLQDESSSNFFIHLCDYHKPLTTVVTYHDIPLQAEGDKSERERQLEKENADLKAENTKLRDEIRKKDQEKKELEEKVAQLERQFSSLTLSD